MGLDTRAKGMTYDMGYHFGYITYGNFIAEVIEKAYGKRCMDIFRNVVMYGVKATKDDEEYWNRVCNNDLDILIFHSDCDGKFTPNECKRIYKSLEPLHSDMTGHNYGTMATYNMFDHWKAIFKYCANRRVNLYYE